MEENIGTTFTRLPDGSLHIVSSNIEGKVLFTVTLSLEDALTNISAAARTLGYRVVPQ